MLVWLEAWWKQWYLLVFVWLLFGMLGWSQPDLGTHWKCQKSFEVSHGGIVDKYIIFWWSRFVASWLHKYRLDRRPRRACIDSEACILIERKSHLLMKQETRNNHFVDDKGRICGGNNFNTRNYLSELIKSLEVVLRISFNHTPWWQHVNDRLFQEL